MDYVDKRLQEEAVKPHVGHSNDAFFTPLNILVLLILGYTIYVFLRPNPPPVLPREPPATVFRIFTPRELLPYTGENGGPIYVAVRGRVFDVTAGRNFYGPEGPYSNFGGRDATRGLACGSFDEDMLTADLDGPLDTLDGLGPDEEEALRGWEETFESKYLVVGRLVAAADKDK
ncbi:cytochrome b5-like Heme/Steroid binding domain-containing protein [Colletotrichum sublineola]|uniref:Putative cytochrome b5-like Heme/Steroid binding domain-containing protein n=1 Tax=Colletotrichum sublineola TaxID=1173701 RepID=A0A066XJA8_COLSU|nr:cytochrome b5-like Heme/Steroid binding domain-containing protein [Colletotrichum sublineola]KDN67719.1 putative cytochrome b5-like Heme/Steroid binding domain-containing protein [Colletotrichum sublineola]